MMDQGEGESDSSSTSQKGANLSTSRLFRGLIRGKIRTVRTFLVCRSFIVDPKTGRPTQAKETEKKKKKLDGRKKKKGAVYHDKNPDIGLKNRRRGQPKTLIRDRTFG